eukprot:TRINITY_DN93657_c0_g1_i1.p1 TRINITY_DN93657_c0_g1~~TRINITY_DN93657_c0_g1_i1.p1  ORF type:complete len:209 (-),score=27.69 TRINITY_DN93657_c0_g1_i1:325-951(-)
MKLAQLPFASLSHTAANVLLLSMACVPLPRHGYSRKRTLSQICASLLLISLLSEQAPPVSFVSYKSCAASARRHPALQMRSADPEDIANRVKDMFDTPMFEEGEQWRALTKIKVRSEPSINAPQLEDRVIEKGEVFIVAEERRAKIPTDGRHRLYLRIASSNGWAFDLGVAGDWYGKPVAEKVYEDEEGSSTPNPLGSIGDAVGDIFR